MKTIKAYVTFLYNGVKSTRMVEGSNFELENYLERLRDNGRDVVSVRYSKI